MQRIGMVNHIEKIARIYCRARNQCLEFSVEIVDFRRAFSARFSANNFIKQYHNIFNSNCSVYLQIMYICRTMIFVAESYMICYFIDHIGSLKRN